MPVCDLHDSVSDSVRQEMKMASYGQKLSPPRIQQRKACPTSFTKASVADLTKPLLFGAADRGPQGENLKDFNNTSNPSLHDGLFLSLWSSNGRSVGANVGMPVLKRK